jgi:hypothetical protein
VFEKKGVGIKTQSEAVITIATVGNPDDQFDCKETQLDQSPLFNYRMKG